ncbi:MAG: T9SS type A sorting domain-containing protein [Lewinellaceae bacterium]|nr:T9SS type A sorting domain-containing protein [Lewinellaceae bacterium]
MQRIITIAILSLLATAASTQPTGWAATNGGVTGGSAGTTVTVTNRSQLIQYASATAPYVIQVQGTINLTLYEQVSVAANKTIVGLGTDAAIRYGGLRINGDNVIVQNLLIYDTYDGDWDGKTHSTDAITVYGASRVWIDHCWLRTSADGLLDVRSNGAANLGDLVTISWTRFSDHNKVMLFGASDDNTWDRDHLRITLHHCWFDGTLDKGVNQRMPRVRYGDVHVFNNYYEKVGSYCIAARIESDVVVENNYFRNLKNPFQIDDVGLGLEDPDLVATGNVFEYTTGDHQTNGSAFNPSDFYTYSADAAMEVPGLVMNGAGRFNAETNQAPTAVKDFVVLNNLTSPVSIQAAQNDIDPDGGDLRLAVILNVPKGGAGIRNNQISYQPNSGLTSPDTILYQLVDTQGGVDTGMVVVLLPGTTATVETLSADRELKVFPNPVRGEATVTFRSGNTPKVDLQLMDLNGRTVKGDFRFQSAAGGLQTWSLDTGGLPPGVYLVQVRDGERFFAERLAVVR